VCWQPEVAAASERLPFAAGFCKGRSRCHVWTESVHLHNPATHGGGGALALAVYSDQSRYAGQPAVTIHRHEAESGGYTWYVSTHFAAADLGRFMLAVCGTVGARAGPQVLASRAGPMSLEYMILEDNYGASLRRIHGPRARTQIGVRSPLPPQLNHWPGGGVEATVREHGQHRWLVLINHNGFAATIRLPAHPRHEDGGGGGGDRGMSWEGAVDLLSGYVVEVDAPDGGGGGAKKGGGGPAVCEQQGSMFVTITLVAQGVLVLHKAE
jgi:hypothetical protein